MHTIGMYTQFGCFRRAKYGYFSLETREGYEVLLDRVTREKVLKELGRVWYATIVCIPCLLIGECQIIRDLQEVRDLQIMLKARRILSSGPNAPLTLPPKVEDRLREQRKRSGECLTAAASACGSAFYDSSYIDGGAACGAGGGS